MVQSRPKNQKPARQGEIPFVGPAMALLRKDQMIEGSLEVKLPTICRDGKQRWEESGRRSQEVRRSEKRKSGKQEDAGARKRWESRDSLCISNDLWLWVVEK